MNNQQHSKPTEQINYDYYREYCRLYLANVVLTSQMRQLVHQKNDLMTKLSKLQKKVQDIQGSSNNQDRQKRFRRTANQIDRHYKCPVGKCQKTYGSQGSMNQHIKLKHPQAYATMGITPQQENLWEVNSYQSSIISKRI